MVSNRIRRGKPVMWLPNPSYRETGASGFGRRPVAGFPRSALAILIRFIEHVWTYSALTARNDPLRWRDSLLRKRLTALFVANGFKRTLFHSNLPPNTQNAGRRRTNKSRYVKGQKTQVRLRKKELRRNFPKTMTLRL